MPLHVQVLWLFILAIPIASVAWTITHEEVFREAREYCERCSKECASMLQRKFFYVFTCEYCLSHWVALFFVLLTGLPAAARRFARRSGRSLRAGLGGESLYEHLRTASTGHQSRSARKSRSKKRFWRTIDEASGEPGANHLQFAVFRQSGTPPRSPHAAVILPALAALAVAMRIASASESPARRIRFATPRSMLQRAAGQAVRAGQDDAAVFGEIHRLIGQAVAARARRRREWRRR